MTGYYCEKCKRLSPERQCTACGKSLAGNTYRNIWTVVRVPASDVLIWRKVLLYLLVLDVLVFLAVLIGSLFTGKVEQALSSNAIAVILSVYPAGLLITLIGLILQGREDIWYTLENDNVRMQVWYRSSHIHSWSRLQSYSARSNCPQPDGIVLTPQKERILPWSELTGFKVQARLGRIWLYHHGAFAPMILRIPAEEFDRAEALVRKACKSRKVKERK